MSNIQKFNQYLKSIRLGIQCHEDQYKYNIWIWRIIFILDLLTSKSALILNAFFTSEEHQIYVHAFSIAALLISIIINTCATKEKYATTADHHYRTMIRAKTIADDMISISNRNCVELYIENYVNILKEFYATEPSIPLACKTRMLEKSVKM